LIFQNYNFDVLLKKVTLTIMRKAFSKIYPYLHWYVNNHGRIEIGPDDYLYSWLRLYDAGGIVLDVDEETLDKSLAKAEKWIPTWMDDIYQEALAELQKQK